MTTSPYPPQRSEITASRPPNPTGSHGHTHHPPAVSAMERLRRDLARLRDQQHRISDAYDRGDYNDARRLEESEVGLLQDVADAADALAYPPHA